ncbi:hypothetical protein J6590_052796 [Homalodisca vitripennis]|nr:hypothetical protein J6590_052796 [Homalodisca vitripennis]
MTYDVRGVVMSPGMMTSYTPVEARLMDSSRRDIDTLSVRVCVTRMRDLGSSIINSSFSISCSEFDTEHRYR